MLPVAISVASENSVSNFTTPFDSARLFLLPSDDHNTLRAIMKDEPYWGRFRRGHCCRKHDKKYATKRQGYIAPHDLIRIHFFLSWFFQYKFRDKDLLLGTSMLYIKRFQLIIVFVSLPSFTLPVELVLCLFSYCFIDHSLYCFFNCSNSCDDSPVRQISCNGHICAYDGQLKNCMI